MRAVTPTIVSASCCMPGMEPFDEQARRAVQQAIAETGVEARVEVMSATTAFFGGLPRPILAEAMRLAQAGRMPMPAVLVNGQPVSFGVPEVEVVKGQISGTFGQDVISTPCVEEMAAFDQFVTFLQQPESDVVVFDTAPTGKTLRELAMPFDWADFLQRQIREGQRLAELMNMDGNSFEDLERDRQRYEHALAVLRNPAGTAFTLVLLPERLPIEETDSAVVGLDRLGIPVQSLVVNQCILPEVIEGSRFLDEIGRRFPDRVSAPAAPRPRRVRVGHAAAGGRHALRGVSQWPNAYSSAKGPSSSGARGWPSNPPPGRTACARTRGVARSSGGISTPTSTTAPPP